MTTTTKEPPAGRSAVAKHPYKTLKGNLAGVHALAGAVVMMTPADASAWGKGYLAPATPEEVERGRKIDELLVHMKEESEAANVGRVRSIAGELRSLQTMNLGHQVRIEHAQRKGVSSQA